MTRCTSTGGSFPLPHFCSACSSSPEVRGFIPSPYPVFCCSHPWPIGLTRHCAWRRMEHGGVGVGGCFPLRLPLALCAGPSFPCFCSTPSNSRVLLAVVGTLHAGCFTSSTLLLHYLQEWTEVIGACLVRARR